jgi:hypothetical protein
LTHPIIQVLGRHALRVRRGWGRVVLRRRPATEGHRETARETGVMVGLMREARAAPEPTVDQQIFLSQSAVGMRARAAVLLSIPNRSLIEERELEVINGWLAEEAARTAGDSRGQPALVPRERPAFAPLGLLGASPVASLLMSPAVWVAAAFAIPASVAAVQTARLNHAKGELRETREDLALAQEQREAWRERAEQYAAAVTDARQTAQQTAEALEAERRRVARAAARERRRNAEIAAVLAGGEPPAWSLRDDGGVQE